MMHQSNLGQGHTVDAPSGGSSLKLIIVAAIGLTWAALVSLHVDGANGPPYWRWHWQRLPFLPLYGLMALGAAPIIGAMIAFDRGAISKRVALMAFAASNFALQLLGGSVFPGGLRSRITEIVDHPSFTSYYTAAKGLTEGVTAQPFHDWIRSFPELMTTFPLHALTKPPGPVLYYWGWIEAVGPDFPVRGVAGCFLGLLGALSIPLTYLVIRELVGDSKAAVTGASLLALCPSLIIFLPQFDQAYMMVTCGLVVLLARTLRGQSIVNPIFFGALLSLGMFFTYSFAVLGVFLLGLTILELRSNRTATRTAAVGAGVALGTIVSIYTFLYLAWGFRPFDTFASALANQARLLPGLMRPYPSTIPWDLYDFALASGWISIPLLIAALANEQIARIKWLNRIVLLQLLAVGASGLLQTETARVWMFLLPLLMIPLGTELARWRASHRLAALIILWISMVTIYQNMVFVA